MPNFQIFRVKDLCLEMIPGRFKREWMEQTNDRFAYRCLPMTVANASGWELLSPCDFEAEWLGTDERASISVRALDGYPHLDELVSSHFGSGILTVRPGYVFVTEPGWGVVVRGAPNFAKDGIAPLEGLVETDWLPFSFTMNWRFTRPGRVTFNKGEPLAFVVPVQHRLLDEMQPTIRDIRDDPELYRRFSEWRVSREEFIRTLAAGEPETLKLGWQRNYSRGTHPDGSLASDAHLIKRTLKTPTHSG